jgi:hypothetical protein
MNDWREDTMDQERNVEPPAEAPMIDAEAPTDEPDAPVMLTDAMCGCACQVKPETPLA